LYLVFAIKIYLHKKIGAPVLGQNGLGFKIIAGITTDGLLEFEL
jgi:hypothetical protein